MQRIVAPARQIPVNSNQVLHGTNFATQNNLVAPQPQRFGLGSALKGRNYQRFTHHSIGFLRRILSGIFVHHARDQFWIQRSPVHADAHRLVKFDGSLNHCPKLVIALAALADVTRIDTQFRQGNSAVRHLGQQLVTIKMKITSKGNIDAHRVELRANLRHRARGFQCVNSDSHDFRSSTRKRCHLRDRGSDIFGIGIGHGLHHDGRITPNEDVANFDLPRYTALDANNC